MRKFAIMLMALVVGILIAGCGGGDDNSPNAVAQRQADQSHANFAPFIPKNQVEGNNYNRSQQIYDDPTTILWCSVLNQSSTSPIVTFPVAGKLTSSTTSAFSPDKVVNEESNASGEVVANPSVDGLYHTNPPPYRYGFTPGGQYIDVFNAPTICTTKPLAFQTTSVAVKTDDNLAQATAQARDALSHGDREGAQQILEEAAGAN